MNRNNVAQKLVTIAEDLTADEPLSRKAAGKEHIYFETQRLPEGTGVSARVNGKRFDFIAADEGRATWLINRAIRKLQTIQNLLEKAEGIALSEDDGF